MDSLTHFTSLHFTHFTSLTSLHSLTHFTQNQPAAWVLQEVEVVGERIWVLGGEGFGTERARLGQGGSSAERARLAQGGFRGVKALAQNVQD